jgi:hypothetical protein
MAMKDWKRCGTDIQQRYRLLRVKDGILLKTASKIGLSTVRNPSSRDGAMEDYGRYCRNTKAVAEAARKVASALTPLPSRVDIGTILDAIADGKSSALTGDKEKTMELYMTAVGRSIWSTGRGHTVSCTNISHRAQLSSTASWLWGA